MSQKQGPINTFGKNNKYAILQYTIISYIRVKINVYVISLNLKINPKLGFSLKKKEL